MKRGYPKIGSFLRIKQRHWQNLFWLALLAGYLVYGVKEYVSGSLCAQMGTDFRGYYASAQIAWQRGIAEIYDRNVQSEYQPHLVQSCPSSSMPQEPPVVFMPYLPIFTLIFLPLTLLSFTSSYFAWSFIHTAGLVLYLIYFSYRISSQTAGSKVFQWVLCLPVLANLILGQVNVYLVICLGQFLLALLENHPIRAGTWLAGMLIKPQVLILLLPGLILSRNWRVLQGFSFSGGLFLAGSLIIGGLDGLWASLRLAAQFAGPLIQTSASMMNWRALAINLDGILPVWLAWSIAAGGMLGTALLVWHFWRIQPINSSSRTVYLMLVTYLGTCIVNWHSHFYLLMLIIPIFIYLETMNNLPASIKITWIFGLPLFYLIISLVSSTMARNWFGLGMLVFNLAVLGWAANQLMKTRGNSDKGNYLLNYGKQTHI